MALIYIPHYAGVYAVCEGKTIFLDDENKLFVVEGVAYDEEHRYDMEYLFKVGAVPYKDGMFQAGNIVKPASRKEKT